MINYKKTFTLKTVVKIFFILFFLSFAYHKPISNTIPFIKLSEFIFLFFLIIFFVLFFKKKIFFSFDKIDLIFLSYPLSLTINIYLSNFSTNTILGFLSAFYLFLVYYISKNLIIQFKLKKKFFLKLITKLGILLLIISTYTIILKLNGLSTLTAGNIENYPFSFNIGFRTRGFMGSSSMLAMFQIISVLSSLILYFNNKKKKYLLISLLILLTLYFTLAKSVLLFISIFLLLIILNIDIKIKNLKNIFIFISFLFFILHAFVTNFLIVGKNTNYLKGDYFTVIDAKPLIKIYDYQIIPSYYYFQKAKNFEIIKNNYLTGIGSYEFKNYKYKNFDYLNKFNPHSVFLGSISENGLINFFSLILINLIIFRTCFKLKDKNFFLIFFYLFLESFNADILTFKIFWVIMAIILSEKCLIKDINEKNN